MIFLQKRKHVHAVVLLALLFSLVDTRGVQGAAAAAVTYYLPWQYGVKARVSQGHHSQYAVDFQLLDQAGNNYDGPITAAADGTIYEVKHNSNITCIEINKRWYTPDRKNFCDGTNWKKYTNYVAIKHAGGSVTYYLHLAFDSVPPKFRKTGQRVMHGEMIGLQGKTGMSDKSHLHFAVTEGTIAKEDSLQFVIKNGSSTIKSSSLVRNTKLISYNAPAIQGKMDPVQPSPLPLVGNTTITGWAKDVEKQDGKVQKVEIWIDGNKRAEAQYGIQRPDAYNGFGFTWSWDTSSVPDGTHTLKVLGVRSNGAYAEVGSANVAVHNTPPNPPIDPVVNCQIHSGVWQNSCNTPAFSWKKPVSSIYIKGYNLYWGPSKDGVPDTFSSLLTYTPPIVQDSATYYLRVSSRDVLDRNGPVATLFTFLYDKTDPTVIVSVNQDAGFTNQINVNVSVRSADLESGVSQMRLSNGLNWSPWQAFSEETLFSIPPTNHGKATVFVQVRDVAGNIGMNKDAIIFSTDQSIPSSENFLLCAQALNSSGGMGRSGNFSIVSAFGETVSSLENNRVISGYIGQTTGCPTTLGFTGYKLMEGAVASSGETHSFDSLVLDGTFGQSTLSTNTQSSQSFRLQGGFWNSSTVP